MLRRRLPFHHSCSCASSFFGAVKSSSSSSSFSFSSASSSGLLAVSVRFVGGKLRQQRESDPQVPDRLRDAFAFYGTDVARTEGGDDGDQDIPYRSPDQRKQMMQGMMGMHSHTISLASLDKVRTALDSVRRRDPTHDDWHHTNALLRTAEMCIELVPEPTDVFPPGDKCWVHLSETQVKRKPYVLHFRECGNTFCVLPVFTQEEYMTHYFQRMKSHETCWFPTPRMGSQRKEYLRNRFPVCAHGPLAKLAALAISMPPGGADETFVMCINPFQQSTKFICYPEMVRLAASEKEREAKEKQKKADESKNRLFGADRNSPMFPRGPTSDGDDISSSSQQQQQQQQPPKPESISDITGRMQERHLEMQRQQDKLLRQMENPSEVSSETRAEKRERLLAQADAQKKQREEQELKEKEKEALASGDILFSAPQQPPQAQQQQAQNGPSAATEAGRRFIAELNTRDKITRETLRKIKMTKITAADGSTAPDLHFSKIFDTSRWWGRRIQPDEAIAHSRGTVPFPEVEDLQKRIPRDVPNVGKTIAQEQQEREQEMVKELLEKKRMNETPEERAAREKREEEAFVKAALSTDSRFGGNRMAAAGPFDFSKESLAEKLPEFHRMKKPPPPKRRRYEEDFIERKDENDGSGGNSAQQQHYEKIDLMNRDIVAALSDVLLETQPYYSSSRRSASNNVKNEQKIRDSAPAAAAAATISPQSQEAVLSSSSPLWRFPVHVPVPADAQRFWNGRVAAKGLDPAANAIRGVRIPRIALDELLLLLFDVPEVKLVVARLVLSEVENKPQPQIRLQVSIVTTDPVSVIEDVVRRERQQQRGDEDEADKIQMDSSRALRLTQDIESGAADGRARVELTWSFPKNKSNSPYEIQFVNMSTTDFFAKLKEDEQEQQQQQQHQSRGGPAASLASSFAILYDRVARGVSDVSSAKVIAQMNLREELDYDGEEMSVTEWHKPDRPFWGASRSM